MLKWLEYDKGSIFRDKSKNGLLFQFLKDYKAEFGGSVNPSCRHCLNTYYTNFLNQYTMQKETIKCDYKLHAKYNGIQLGPNGQPIRNGEMTNKIAKELLDKHPHGAKLFEVTPESPTTKKEDEKADRNKSEKILDKKASTQRKSEKKPKK